MSLITVIAFLSITLKMIVWIYYVIVLKITFNMIFNRLDCTFTHNVYTAIGAVVIVVIYLLAKNQSILAQPTTYQHLIIEILNEKNKESQDHEVWLTALKTDGIEQNLAHVVIGSQWQYKIDSNVIYTNAKEESQRMELDVKASSTIENDFEKKEVKVDSLVQIIGCFIIGLISVYYLLSVCSYMYKESYKKNYRRE